MKLSNAFLNNIGEGTDFMSSLKLFRSWEQRILATYLLLSPFSRYLSAWHFSRSVLWVYFYFPVTNILRTNNTTRWRKNKQKNTHQYSASFEALKYSNISTFDSSIRKFEHFNTSIQWVLLNRTPTSTQLHPPLPSSIQLHPPPPSSFQPPPSSLQHPQQYLNQNIARNWAISPNLGQKLKVVHFNWKLAHMVYWRCWFQIQT